MIFSENWFPLFRKDHAQTKTASINTWGQTKERTMKRNLTILTLATALAFPTLVKAADIDWKKVDAALGKTAAVSGEVHRYGIPRSDLHVTLDGVAIKPALPLGGWVAFAPMHGEAMVMGDLVLLETEITPVMTKFLNGGAAITAISTHIPRAPRRRLPGLGHPGQPGDAAVARRGYRGPPHSQPPAVRAAPRGLLSLPRLVPGPTARSPPPRRPGNPRRPEKPMLAALLAAAMT